MFRAIHSIHVNSNINSKFLRQIYAIPNIVKKIIEENIEEKKTTGSGSGQ